jgi:hypothetical protein
MICALLGLYILSDVGAGVREAGLNTSTVAMRIVGDERGTQCLGVYNWTTLLLGGNIYGDLALHVGGVLDLLTVKYGRKSSRTRT